MVAAVIAAVALGLNRRARTGVLGLVFGCAVPLLYVAYLNRGGPGRAGTTIADTASCIEQVSPWGWIAAAAVLFVAGGTQILRRS